MASERRYGSALDSQFIRREGVCRSLLIESVELRAERQQRGDSLDHLSKPAALIICKRLVVTAIGLAATAFNRGVAPLGLERAWLRSHIASVVRSMRSETNDPGAAGKMKLQAKPIFQAEANSPGSPPTARIHKRRGNYETKPDRPRESTDKAFWLSKNTGRDGPAPRGFHRKHSGAPRKAWMPGTEAGHDGGGRTERKQRLVGAEWAARPYRPPALRKFSIAIASVSRRSRRAAAFMRRRSRLAAAIS